MFARLLTLVGIIMLAVGIFGIVRSNQLIPNLNFGDAMSIATDAKAREAELCKPGEKLEEEKGASTYTLGRGSASPVQVFCVDSEGNRRDVTGDLANSLVGGIDGIFTGVMSSMMGSFIYYALMGFGLVLTIIGLVISRFRRRMNPMSIGGAGATVYSTSFGSQNPGGSVDLNQLIQQARQMKTATSGDLTARLKQLDDALKAGLISQTEYDRARQNILDTLK
ncbi:MAG: SHOCT domain-containing protein [Chloroflexi bacterium]|nr:SHOCT domain-containing protein [Chloroflexota bacterium]